MSKSHDNDGDNANDDNNEMRFLRGSQQAAPVDCPTKLIQKDIAGWPAGNLVNPISNIQYSIFNPVDCPTKLIQKDIAG